MSGHNKWSKIKHKKGASDAKRSKIFSKHARLIAVESKKAGGTKSAPGLRAAIERAKGDLMPNENIDRAIQKGIGGVDEVMEEMLYETFGPAGTAILVSTLTDNKNRTSQELRHLLSKAGSALGAPGSSLWAFTKKENYFIPINPLSLSDEEGEKLAVLIEAIEEHDDVQDVYTSADEASPLSQ